MRVGLGLALLSVGPTAIPISISPTSQTTEAGLQYQFTATNGAGTKTWSIVSDTTGGASVNSSGLATAGPNAGTFIVRVSDLTGHADSSVTNNWSPRTLTGVLSWHRADVGITLDGSNNVSAWQDFGGSGDANRNAAQTTSAKRPAQPAADASLNNQKSITFNETTAQFLATGTYSVAPAAPLTIIVVFANAITGSFLVDSLAGDTQACTIECNNAIGFALGGTTHLNGSAYTTAGHLFLGLLNGASSSERKDNMTTTDVAGTTTFAATGFTFGDDRAGGAHTGAAHRIAEIVVVNGDLGATDKTNLRSYVQTRYGLTIGA